MNQQGCGGVHRRAQVFVTIAAVLLASTASLPPRAQDGPDLTFEVVSIKSNPQGFIDLGGGLRLLRGETRCQATDAPSRPGDPLPAPGPGRCVIRNSTVKEMIDVAYGLRFGPIRAVLNQMVTGGPSWTETAAFDVEAKAQNRSVTLPQMQGMLRTMLADRFGLTFHREPRQSTVLALVVARGGHKLKAGEPNAKPTFTAAPVVRGQNVPAATIANFLAQRLGRAVVDQTELSGGYDFTLTWAPDPTELGHDGIAVGSRPADSATASLTTALQEQLGVRLEARPVAVDAFVIDAIHMPTPN